MTLRQQTFHKVLCQFQQATRLGDEKGTIDSV
ncbi:hypothetical protein RKD55_003426 [Rossellomorea marisflavi]